MSKSVTKAMQDMLTPEGLDKIANQYIGHDRPLTQAKIKAFRELYQILIEQDKAMDEEFILCAATWFDDGKKYEHQPINIKTGLVFCGFGHHSIFQQIGGTVAKRQELGIHEKEQGFVTSKNRFVGRKEAAIIARKAGQIHTDIENLHSEDLRA